MRERRPPEDPREWLNRAASNLALARTRGSSVYREDLCFHAQQAAEKAIKAPLISRHVKFPYVHDIAQLLTLLEWTGLEIPESIKQAEGLTRFAVFTRYPGPAEPIGEKEYKEAVRIAQRVLRWAGKQLRGKSR